MSKHTPEPWTKYTHHELPSRMIVMNINDYQRATHCVNILAGLEYPGQYLSDLQAENARLREALKELNFCAIFANEEVGIYSANVKQTPEVIAHNAMAKRLTNAIIKASEALKGGPHETI